MEKVIQKAAVLIEALPYMQRFRNETIVVKFGGSIMEDEEGVRGILQDVAFMACVGLRPVLVHGGGKNISAAMRAAGLQAHFVQGMRVTDEASMRVVEQVLNQEVNTRLVEVLESFQCRGRGIHGDDILRVRKHQPLDPVTGKKLDLGLVGEVESVDTAPVEAFLQAHITPVITPLGRGADRQVYNVNADAAAAALASALGARKLVFLTDVPGLLENAADPASVFSTVRIDEVEDLMRRKVIQGGMLPKIGGAVNALRSGVAKTHLIDASMPHSLLLELFTDRGVGTEIVP